ncbi:MAG: DUF535 family protein, partial [Ancalomicrobiaceae bacterium]|nr:DUF535 family protein [Ancalomicrobiaceae bacterium]
MADIPLQGTSRTPAGETEPAPFGWLRNLPRAVVARLAARPVQTTPNPGHGVIGDLGSPSGAGDLDASSNDGNAKVGVGSVLKIFYYTYALARFATLKKSVVFFGRSLTQLKKAVRWIDFIEQYGRVTRLGQPPLELVRKSLATYFFYLPAADWKQSLLINHFEVSSRVFRRETLEALWSGRVVDLGSVKGRRELYPVLLCRSDQAGARHEGELTVSLFHGTQPIRLYRMTFIFVTDPDGTVSLAIGGMQGPGVPEAKAALVDATRDLGGLRPKDAVLLVLKGLAFKLGASSIHGIANA